MKRVADSSQRMRTKLCAYSQYKLPAHLRSLKGAAAGRRTKLLFLPSGMSKRVKNQSHYNQRLFQLLSISIACEKFILFQSYNNNFFG